MNQSKWLRRHLAGLGMVVVTVAAATTGAAPPAAAEGRLLGTENPNAIADSYIVVFKERAANYGRTDVRKLVDRLAAKYDIKVEHEYEHALHGFAGPMTPAVARRLAAEADVSYVEQNGSIRLQQTQTNPPSWGLDRIDQRDLPLDGSYTYQTTASNVSAYVIDTGIRVSHATFGGRASWGTNTTGDGNDTDCNVNAQGQPVGRGTHVAGTIGGAEYGVAKSVTLIAVKVLGCNGSGTLAGVAAGVAWVTGHHVAGVPAVANMSLGASGSDTVVENAVRNSIADGVVYTISSGNSNQDACNFTPARVAEAITVNATTSTDARASYSNWGTCTDIFAPGDSIVSSSNASDAAGTSCGSAPPGRPVTSTAAGTTTSDGLPRLQLEPGQSVQ